MARRLRDLPPPLGFLLAHGRHAAVMAGYWIRPYDFHRDARRWRWQRSGCAQSRAMVDELTPEQLDRIASAVARIERDRQRRAGR